MLLAWHLWLIAALILLLLELLGTGFFAFALGLAALVAMISALMGLEAAGQWFTFAIAAALIAPALKVLFRRLAPSRRSSALAGERGEREGELVQLENGEFRLKLEGDLFPVRSESNRPLLAGARVKVRRFDGITALID
ncbi:NfeD family protein [Zobellella maritima]|uniref:NfeD family protein n=1 Tax=Zobellella maritima TaxID=2059725 RepID=UPI001E51DDD5|nr:NfeD family protein [Zobellella maritima]